METHIKQMKCGGCGEEKHRIYMRETGEIVTECITCRSSSELTIPQPRLTVKYLSGDGNLCVWDK